jgi:putative tricarboxylic transport membrane protein
MSRTRAERLAALAILLFSLAYLWLAFGIKVPASSDDSPVSARSFPLVLGPMGIVLALILLIRPPDGAPVDLKALSWGRGAGLVALIAFFALAITPLGFVITSALFLAGGFFLLGERRPLVLVAVALGVSLGFFFLFRALDVSLDWGLLERVWS